VRRISGAPCGPWVSCFPDATSVRIAIRRADSVNTVTRAAPAHSADSVAAWPGVGLESSVCSVTRYGMPRLVSALVRCSTYEPFGPPKMPYSCWISTTPTPAAWMASAAPS
jgi:hypothetical protein